MAEKKIVRDGQDTLNSWIAELEPAIQGFFNAVGPDLQRELDFSPASLDDLEAWLLEHYPDEKVIYESKPEGFGYADQLLDTAYRYAAETMRRNIEGSFWGINLDHPKIAGFGVPRLHGPEDNPFSAAPLVGAVLRRRTSGMLRSQLERLQSQRANFYRGKRRAVQVRTPEAREVWLSEVEEAVGFFLNFLPQPLVEKLDFSAESLEVLEQWLLQECPDVHSADHPIAYNQRPDISDGAARYVGEVFRRHCGGHWEIVVHKPPLHKFKYFPFVHGDRLLPYTVCPVWDIMAAVRDRKGNKLPREFDKIAHKMK